MITVRVAGANRLITTLRQAGVDVTQLKRLNKESAVIVAGAATANAPIKSGKLARTIRTGATQKAGIVRVGNNTSTRYAGAVHWGWGGGASRIKGRYQGNPFLYEAGVATESAWVGNYQRGVEDILNNVQGA